MTAPLTASERDLRALAGIISGHRADLPAQGLPPSLLADLMGQIRCDTVAFKDSTVGGSRCGSSRESPLPMPTRGKKLSIGSIGSITGTAYRAVTPTAPATCAPS